MTATDTTRRAARRASTRLGRRRWMWAVLAIAFIVIATAAWVGIRGMMAKNELESAVPLARQTQQFILDGNTQAAVGAARELSAKAANAASLTSDPVWRIAEALPWVGVNLYSMGAVAASVDRIADGAVIPLAEAAGDLDLAAFRPIEGRVDLGPLIALQKPVSGAAEAVTDARAMLDDERVASDQVIGPLAQARDQLTGLVDEANSTIDALDRAVRLVPTMLGADGARDVLLLFQNNAELRSTGGISGALALLHTDGGAFQLVQQANSSDFPRFDPPVIDLPLETRALWGDNTARYIQDVNFTPQFPLAASIAREMWAREFGIEPDSVVALDPIVLSYLLRATGPIAMPTGEQLTADNAVQLLLSDVYQRYEDPDDQDEFFAGAAAAVLAAVSGGNVDPRALIGALAESGSERRILIWNADATEQDILANTTLAGDLPVSGARSQAFGVYFNDMTMSKMDVYLDVQISAGSQVCRDDGLPRYEVEVSMTNTAPADAASGLPAYVTGGNAASVDPGNIATSIHVYSAPGTYNLGVTQGGQAAPYAPTTEAGYTVSRVTSDLAPGESASWRFSFLGDVSEKRSVVIQSTPMIYKSEVSGLALSCD